MLSRNSHLAADQAWGAPCLVAVCFGVSVSLLGVHSAKRLAPFAVASERTVRRQFLVINLAQYLALALIVELFARSPHGDLLIPAGIGVVGLHFLPLAIIFRSKPHAWISAAMVSLAAVLLWVDLPPFSPVGILAGGTVLLLGAALLWATAAAKAREAGTATFAR